MNLVSLFMIYAMLWWVVFYMVLPFGVKIPYQPEQGHADSAPKKPYILIKVIITTLISFVLTWLIKILIEVNYFNFQS